MFGNREKRNREEMERTMYAFTFMPTHEFERGSQSDGQKCNFKSSSELHYFLSKMRVGMLYVWNRSLTSTTSEFYCESIHSSGAKNLAF